MSALERSIVGPSSGSRFSIDVDFAAAHALASAALLAARGRQIASSPIRAAASIAVARGLQRSLIFVHVTRRPQPKSTDLTACFAPRLVAASITIGDACHEAH